jgi:thiol-disulfide isomerase/thioredoxin
VEHCIPCSTPTHPLTHIAICELQVVIHFWAPWCEPCAFLDTVLAQLVAEHPSLHAVRVEAEEAVDISGERGRVCH